VLGHSVFTRLVENSEKEIKSIYVEKKRKQTKDNPYMYKIAQQHNELAGKE
jgi:hypothetical protein